MPPHSRQHAPHAFRAPLLKLAVALADPDSVPPAILWRLQQARLHTMLQSSLGPAPRRAKLAERRAANTDPARAALRSTWQAQQRLLGSWHADKRPRTGAASPAPVAPATVQARAVYPERPPAAPAGSLSSALQQGPARVASDGGAAAALLRAHGPALAAQPASPQHPGAPPGRFTSREPAAATAAPPTVSHSLTPPSTGAHAPAAPPSAAGMQAAAVAAAAECGAAPATEHTPPGVPAGAAWGAAFHAVGAVAVAAADAAFEAELAADAAATAARLGPAAAAAVLRSLARDVGGWAASAGRCACSGQLRRSSTSL